MHAFVTLLVPFSFYQEVDVGGLMIISLLGFVNNVKFKLDDDLGGFNGLDFIDIDTDLGNPQMCCTYAPEIYTYLLAAEVSLNEFTVTIAYGLWVLLLVNFKLVLPTELFMLLFLRSWNKILYF